MSFADKTLTCRDCRYEFTFTRGEQEFYAQKGFDHEPTRCPNCRQARKQSRHDSGYDRAMNRTDGYDRGSSSDHGPREIHTTTCAGCGNTAEVPFVPRGDKPIYCRACFQQRRPTSRTTTRW